MKKRKAKYCLLCKEKIPFSKKHGSGQGFYCGQLCGYLDTNKYVGETRDKIWGRLKDGRTIASMKGVYKYEGE